MKKPYRKIIKQRVKEYRNLARKIHDWDYEYILEAERLQLVRTLKCIDKYRSHTDSGEDVRWMKIANKILSMLLNSSLWWSYDIYNKKYNHPYVNTRNAKRFIPYWDKFEGDQKDFMKVDLYEEKLWYLYHKIRLYKMRRWWD